MFFRKIMKQNMTQAPIVYQSGTNVKLIHKAEYCKSIIADGKELITGKESGELIVPELNDEKVYITFKEDATELYDTFSGCSALKSIPENLFANCPNVFDFSGSFRYCQSLKSIPEKLFANCPNVDQFYQTFEGCYALTSIPAGLFDNNRMVTYFSGTFLNCWNLTGESPYTMVDGQKVHLYERANYPEHFTAPTDFKYTFSSCTGLTDYAQIPNEWKE